MARVSKALMRLGMLAAIGAAGCANQKKEPVATGPDPSAELKALQDQLAQLEKERQAAAARAEALERENGQLKMQLSQGGAAPEGWTSIPGGAMISLEGKVLFDSGKNVLKPAGKKSLDEIASTIRSKYPNYDVYVFGHTDSEPIRHSKWTDNYELSCERALAVVRYLISRGVPGHLAACGWGEHRPVASNAKATERAFNRRVEIYVMAPQGTKVSDKPIARSPVP